MLTLDELKRQRYDIIQKFKRHEIHSQTAIKALATVDREIVKASRRKKK